MNPVLRKATAGLVFAGSILAAGVVGVMLDHFGVSAFAGPSWS